MDEEQPQYSKAAWWGEDRGLKGKKPGKEHLYRATVYNIEVEDFHTYYVGERGTWVHNKNLQINLQGGTGLTARVNPTVFHTRAELLAYLRKNAASIPSDSIFIIRSQFESQYLWRGEPQPRSAKFEDKVPSRLYKRTQNSKGETLPVNYEYAVVYRDARYPEQELRYLAVEGRLDDFTFVDNKLLLFKNDDELGVLDSMYRTALRFQQNPAAAERMLYQFNPRLDGKASAELIRAQSFLDDIVAGRKGYGFVDNRTPTPAEAALNNLIAQMIQAGRFLVRDAPLSAYTPQPQEVLEEGAGLSVGELELDHVYLQLQQARQYWLDQGASLSQLNKARFAVADLPAGWAARADGDHLITLDARGAGWGWYVDATPADNSEFMPVSADPTTQNALGDYDAPVGGPAAGKLDLLTVLIHELGHVLGMPSTAFSDNVMSRYLAPGQRRLPDAVDIAALEASGMPYYVGPSIVFVRPPDEVAVSVTGPSTQAGPVTVAQAYELAGWQLTAGSGRSVVDAGGPVTLSESATSHTSLAQAFHLGANDRYLTFTTDRLDLDSGSTGPADAFEVALLDPTSYDSLLTDGSGNAGIGLPLGDAALNIQRGPDGQLVERRSTGITSVTNADGSVTYSIDLRTLNAGANAGRAVLLSFDLIGFGAADSQVTIRDIRTGSAPQTVDDTVTTAEDTPLVIDALGNDIDATQPGNVPAIVSGPAHGIVSVNTDGTFTYTPNPNYHGPDSFTYNVGPAAGGVAGVDVSKTATVHIQVTSVNDAPMVSPVGASTAEDTPLSLSLLAQATDVDGDALTLSLEGSDGPQHGTVQLLDGGVVLYTPDANYYGTDSFTYTISDGQTSVSARVDVQVTAVNDTPTLGDLSITLAEDGSALVNPLEAANDIDGDALTPAIVNGPLHGTVTLNADGTFTYQPDANYSGADSFTYTVSDGELVSQPATIHVTVTPVNDAPTLTGQSHTMAEDGAVAMDLLATAADVDSTTLAVSIVSGPAHGTLTLNADGTFSYRPEADYFGADSFTYRAGDGELESGVATVSIDVTPVNDAPVLANQAQAVPEDGALDIDLLASAADIDSTALAVLIVDEPLHGTLIANADGTYGYRANADYNGPDSFTYTVNDGSLLSNVATVSIWVTPVNDMPTLDDQSFAVAEDGSYAGDLLATADDIDSTSLTPLVVDDPAHGTLTVHADGTFTYVADPDYFGPDSFTYVVTDGELMSEVATVTMTVTPVNDAPTLGGQTHTVAEDVELAGNLLATAADIECATLAATIVTGPSHGTGTVSADGTFSYQPHANFNGTDTFTYTVTDGDLVSNVATIAIDVSAVNDAPTLAGQTLTVAEDGDLAGNLLASASDIDSATLTATIVTGPSHGTVTVSADGTFSYQPHANFNGTDTFTYTVTDGDLVSNVATIAIYVSAVNDAPTLAGQTLTVAEDGDLAGNLLASASDMDSATLTATIVTGPAHGTLALNADGTFGYKPDANYNGADSFSYTVTDGELVSNVATVTIGVTAANDAPALAGQSLVLAEDGELTGNLLTSAADIDSAALTATIVDGPFHGTLTLNADGTFSYKPHADYNGTDSFSYTVTDGELVSNVATVTIGVSAVNDAPTLADQSHTVAEDGDLAGSLLASAADIDSVVLTAAVIDGPTHGKVTVSADGTFSYKPHANYNGPDSFTYTVTDGDLSSGVATVTITVTPVNDAPTTGDQSMSVAEDGVLAGNLLAAAADIDSSALTGSIVSGPTRGTVMLHSDGTFTYRPTADYNGPDSFTYTVTDGELVSNVATVTIGVTAVNDAPTLAGQSLVVAEDGELTGNLLATATDIDSSALTASIVNGPAHGVLTVNSDGTSSYKPTANYSGTDSFTYTVTDGDLVSSLATVTIAVTPVNDAPTAGDQSMTVAEDGVLSGSLLAAAADIDSVALTGSIVSGPAHGAVTLHADGTFTYQPDANYNGPDSFTYAVTDGGLVSNLATVTIGVTAVNDAPTLSGQALTVAEDGELTGNLLAGAADIDSAPLTATIVDGPAHGALTVNADGTFSYRPHANYNGTDSLTYTVTDGELVSVVATVTIVVTPVNDAPTAGDLSLAVAEDGVLTGSLLAVAGDIDSTALSGSIVSGPMHGAVTLHADGTFTYRPAADYNGPDSFTYTVTDGDLVSDVATVTIGVAAVNDAPTLAGQALTVAEDGELTGNLLAGASDIDSATLTATVVDGPAHGTLIVNADGSFSYKPAADYSGPDSFTYSVTDGALVSNVATVTIGVTAVNDSPSLSSQTLTVAEDGVLTGNLLASAADVDSATLTATVVTGPAQGVLTVHVDGTFSYKPNANYSGPDSFTYKVNDGSLDSDTVTMSIDVTAINDAPVAGAFNAELNEDSAVSFTLPASDLDTPAAQLHYLVVNAPLHGTVQLTTHADGTVTAKYTPIANYNGTDSFTYKVSDGTLESNVATVSFNVKAVNDPPTWTSTPPTRFEMSNITGPDSGRVFKVAGPAGSTTTLTFDFTSREASYDNEIGLFRVDDADGRIGNLMPNDAGYAKAALASNRAIVIFASGADEGAVKTVTLTGGQFVGTYLIQDGTTSKWRHKNPNNQTSKEPVAFFSLAQANPDGDFDHIKADWSVDSAGRPTLAIRWEDLTGGGDRDYDDAVITATGLRSTTQKAFVYDASAVDVDGDTVTYSIKQAPSGVAINAATGQVTWAKPVAGNHTFTVSVTDGKGGVADQTFTLTVAEANTAPTARNASYEVDRDSSIRIDLRALIADAEGDVLTLMVSNPAKGTLTKNADGTYTYKPNRGYTGTDTFSYTVSDGRTSTAAKVSLQVR
ncbi:tandem-95 repeat protein [Ramlibacter sp.]|uniref:tandem-95 repeat protein n=1 Tax=Ramlibacter sp. TaxID=1917967 RepID=UPI0035B3E5F6